MAEKAVPAFAENGGNKYVFNIQVDGTYKRKKISGDMDEIGGSSLPEVSGSDNGKALIVAEGEWTAANIPSQLPSVTAADEGKVLAVNSSGVWAASPAATQDAQTGDVTIA